MSVRRRACLLAMLSVVWAAQALSAVKEYPVPFAPGITLWVYDDVIVAQTRVKGLSPDDLRRRIEALKALTEPGLGEISREPKVDLLAAYLVLKESTQTTPEEDGLIFTLATRDPSVVARAEADILYLRSLTQAIRNQSQRGRLPVTDKTGLILGFLSADPAEQVRTVRVPGQVSISRHFDALPSRGPTKSESVYAIRLWIDKSSPPPGTHYEVNADEVQPIFVNGKLQQANWSINFSANQDFGEASFPLKAELLEYPNLQAWQLKKSQNDSPITVPIPQPSFKPESNPFPVVQIWVPILIAIIGAAGVVIAAMIGRRHPAKANEQRVIIE